MYSIRVLNELKKTVNRHIGLKYGNIGEFVNINECVEYMIEKITSGRQESIEFYKIPVVSYLDKPFAQSHQQYLIIVQILS